PMLFFTYDLEHYKNSLRGFYFDFENEAPGPLIKTNETLIHAIKNIEQIQQEYEMKYEEFHERFCSYENGTAAKSIVERFFYLMRVIIIKYILRKQIDIYLFVLQKYQKSNN